MDGHSEKINQEMTNGSIRVGIRAYLEMVRKPDHQKGEARVTCHHSQQDQKVRNSFSLTPEMGDQVKVVGICHQGKSDDQGTGNDQGE